jgi:HPt (histidine-containing phosphotransfer) domain-containing protein
MDEYISKPINCQELERAIAAIIPGLNKASTSEEQKPDPGSAATWDITKTLDSLGGDKELLREVVEILLAEAPQQMARLRRAIAEGDATSIERMAHGLKGELGYLGISELSQGAGQLEGLGRRCELQKATEVFADFETQISAILNKLRDVIGMDLKTQLDPAKSNSLSLSNPPAIVNGRVAVR